MIVAIYSLNWNANDSSGNWYNWTATNVTYPAGKVWPNSALFAWNGYISISSWIGSITNVFTLSCYIKTTFSWYGIFMTRWNVGSWNYCSIWTLDWQVAFFWYWWSWFDVRSTKLINDWKWYHIAITFNSNTVNIYIDWVLNKTQNVWSQSSFNFWTNPYIWAYKDWTNNLYFTWNVDEFIVRNEALTPAQVKNEYLFYNWFM